MQLTGSGSFSEPGTAGMPVMKSLVTNGRRTTERSHEGFRSTGSRSKCNGNKTTGICEIFLITFASCKIFKQNGEQNIVFVVFNQQISLNFYLINYIIRLSHLRNHMFRQICVRYVGDGIQDRSSKYVTDSIDIVQHSWNKFC